MGLLISWRPRRRVVRWMPSSLVNDLGLGVGQCGILRSPVPVFFIESRTFSGSAVLFLQLFRKPPLLGYVADDDDMSGNDGFLFFPHRGTPQFEPANPRPQSGIAGTANRRHRPRPCSRRREIRFLPRIPESPCPCIPQRSCCISSPPIPFRENHHFRDAVQGSLPLFLAVWTMVNSVFQLDIFIDGACAVPLHRATLCRNSSWLTGFSR